MPAELPVPVLINLIQRHHPGDLHPILAGGERYVSSRFEAETDRAVQSALDRAGVHSNTQFRTTLTLLQHATAEHYGWIYSGTSTYAVLVASRRRSAVTLIRRDDQVSLHQADPDHPAWCLVSHLPDVPAARSPSISVPTTDFRTSNAKAGEYMHRATAARSHEARRLDTLLRSPRLGGARLYTATRDHTGTRHRSQQWLTILDTSQGRWLIYITTGAINAVPATPTLIATKLTTLK